MKDTPTNTPTNTPTQTNSAVCELEQIEEIAKIIHDADKANRNTFPLFLGGCLAKHGASRTDAAVALYNEGYRKQSEGEWIIKGDYLKIMECSACGFMAASIHEKTRFCPNCGAKMKGGAE